MRPSLVVFIDCLPFQSLEPDFLPALQSRGRIVPGFGYSVNIVAELFAGKTPDDLGYFNIFNYAPESRWLWPWFPALKLLAPIRRSYIADRIAHKVLGRTIGPVANIPLEYLGYFEPTGVYPFSTEFGHTSVFTDPDFRGTCVFHSDLKGVRAPARDQILVDRALAAVQKGESLFLSLSDLDAIGHAHGIGSGEFQDRLARLNGWLGELIERFYLANPEGYVAVTSDHGASDPSYTFDLGIERKFGRAHPERYMFFLDATIGRFWIADDELRREIASYLEGLVEGHLITEEERTRYGISSPAFGDLIWVVGEPWGISPSFLGRGLPKSLHGYHPELPSQKAVFLASESLPQEEFLPREVHQLLRMQMGLSDSAEVGG